MLDVPDVALEMSPPLYRDIPQLLQAQAERAPDTPALLAPGRIPLTYGRLYQHLIEVTHTLRSLGLDAEDRIALVLPNGPEMAVAFLTVTAAATCIPMNPSYSLDEFQDYLANLHPRALVIQKGVASPACAVARAQGMAIIELAPLVDSEVGLFTLELARASMGPNKSVDIVSPDATALLLLTSGTTTQSKIVPLTHGNVCAAAYYLCHALSLSEGDRCLNILPLFHAFGLVSTVLVSMAAGSSLVCSPGFSASQFFTWMAAFRPTWYAGVPTMHQAILKRAVRYQQTIASCPLRFIRSGAAPLSPSVRDELEAVFNTTVFEGYGMSETSGGITSHPPRGGERKVGSVGTAIGVELRAMDASGVLLPTDGVGEIVVRGASIFQGYEKTLEANSLTFMHDWFRTGDTGYVDAEGYVFITGRLNPRQVNRGGEKIALQELEDVLYSHPEVDQAVMLSVPHPELGEDVAAVVVLHGKRMVTETDLQAFMATRIAAFKVPRRLHIVDTLPLGPTGKVQHAGLLEIVERNRQPARGRIADGEEGLSHTPLESRLVELWQEVLDVDEVGLDDDFFDLGGDSILAIQLLSRVREIGIVDLSLFRFFEVPTARTMATHLGAAGGERASVSMVPLTASLQRGAAPLSYGQQRLWFMDQLGFCEDAYNLPHLWQLSGSLEIKALEQSLNTIVRRHDILRTVLETVDGHPVQIVRPEMPVVLQVVELQTLTPEDRHTKIQQIAQDEAQRLFSLNRGPLLRASLLKVAPEEHVLLLTVHHIVFDHWSLGILWRELATLYAVYCRDREDTAGDEYLAPLPIQYADFSIWQRQVQVGQSRAAALDYWKQQLGTVSHDISLPTDRPRAARQTFRGASHRFEVSMAETAMLKLISQQNGATLFMTLLAAFNVVLGRYTGRNDIVVGTPVAGRDRIETEFLIGCFVNMLVLRTALQGDPTFTVLLRRVRAMALEAYAHQDLPFERVVEALQPDRNLSRQPLFQVMFVFQNTPTVGPELPELSIKAIPVEHQVARFDLTLFMEETASGLIGHLNYCTDLFDAETISRMGRHLQAVLTGVVANPQQRLSTISLLTRVEREQVLGWSDGDANEVETETFQRLFAAQVERTPDAVAVVWGDHVLTYRGLSQGANVVAQVLRSAEIGPGDLVGLCTARTPNLVMGLLGILKAGAAFVPLDPASPTSRLGWMLADAQVTMIVTDDQLVGHLPLHGRQSICLVLRSAADIPPTSRDFIDLEVLNPVASLDQSVLDSVWDAHETSVPARGIEAVTSLHLAYVMYTSGSTGEPKGVMVSHGALMNYVKWALQVYISRDACGAPVHSSIGFDATLTSLLVPLLAGQPIFLLSESQELAALSGELEHSGDFSFIKVTPAHMGILANSVSDLSITQATRRLVIGGEALLREHIASWQARAPTVPIINEYGPTEAVVGCCVFESLPDTARAGRIPIGRPIHNSQLYILDEQFEPVPIGIPGELYIGGASLALGYCHRPSWTAERFLPNPFSSLPGARLYQTGDLARYLPKGQIDFLGRRDQQVNLRGFRIELGEIESVLIRHADVREAVVTVHEFSTQDRRLVAYVVPQQRARCSVDRLRPFCQDQLPSYMIPSDVVILDALPLTLHGKLDREALPAPSGLERRTAYARPQTELEQHLAEVWQGVLQVERVGVQDNFFDLGGHSLLLVSLQNEIHRRLAQPVRLLDLFEYPTVRTLAKFFSQTRSKPVEALVQTRYERGRNRREAVQRRRPRRPPH